MARAAFATSILAVALVSACGDDGGPAPVDSVDYPECSEPNKLVLEGELDGNELRITRDFTSYAFINKLGDDDGSLVIPFAGDGDPKIEITFSTALVRGGEVDARGVVNLPADDVVAGNCETDGLSGRIAQTDDGEVYMFVLRDLRAAPFCDGAPIAGELRGCAILGGFDF